MPGAAFHWACLSELDIAEEQSRLFIVARRLRDVGKDFFANLPICPNIAYTPLDRNLGHHAPRLPLDQIPHQCEKESYCKCHTSHHDHVDLLMNLELMPQE